VTGRLLATGTVWAGDLHLPLSRPCVERRGAGSTPAL